MEDDRPKAEIQFGDPPFASQTPARKLTQKFKELTQINPQ
jgi:hypothetical protein